MKLSSRILSVLLALCMILSLAVSGFAAPASENITTTATGYTSAEDVVYNDSGYIANWGARGEIATFLSTYAQDFYTGDYTYEALSSLSGGTGSSDAGSSDLYAALSALVTSKQTKTTSYSGSGSMDATNFYHYTDCVGGDTSQVSLFYRGDMVVGPWQSGNDPYNQEHMWPKSKLSGSNSTDIGDIMHLRATNSSENSSRGNKAYGSTTDSDYYYPGDSVIGDCARTILYMYVRWGNGSTLWGASGAIESLDVLLDWMAKDPVDTWEMGRNDAVQSITGTRNVFVDYPELAWQLFGQTAPEDLSSPSAGGSTTITATSATLVTDPSTLVAGDKIIIAAADADYALSTTQSTNNRSQAAIVKNDSVITFGSDVQVIKLVTSSVEGAFGFEVTDGYLFAASSSKNYLRTQDSLTENSSWKISLDENNAISVVAQGANTRATMQYNSANGLFACYETASQGALSIYKVDENVVHTHDYTIEVTEPTCTAGGYTTYTCACNYSYVADEKEALGHDFADGTCSRCGEEAPSAYTLVTDLSQLTIGDKIVIVAADADVALSTNQTTNNRSQAAVTKTGNTVTFGDDVQVITLESGLLTGTYAFNVGNGYLYAASSSSNHLKTQSTLNENGCWLITFTDGVVSVVAQGTNTRNNLRYNSTSALFSCYGSGQGAVAIYALSASTHTHSYTGVVTDATCTTQGYTTYTCSGCGNVYVSDYTDTVDHSYDDGVVTDATCTEKGSTLYTCTICKATKTESIDALGHDYVDGTCSRCGEKETGAVEGWVKVDLSDITSTDAIIITMTKGDVTWALPNNKGTSTPNAVVVTIDGEVLICDDSTILVWNIYNTDGSLIIRPDGVTDNALYSTTSNNGVRVGTDANNVWTIDSTYGYLKNTSRSRYLGVYNSQDWRTYTSMHSNIADQTLNFWKWVDADSEEECLHTNTTIVAGKDATCTETGLTEGKHCEVCGHVLVEQTEIPVLSHTEVIDAAVDATCTETGLTEGKHCEVCGEITVAQEEVAALGHTEVIDAAVDATCTETGLTEGKHCEVCGEITVAQEVVDALGHSYADGICGTCGEADPDYVKPIVQPVITVGSPSVSFEGEIRYNIYFSASQLDDVTEMGLVLFNTKVADGTVETADQVIPGYSGENGSYMVHTDGIAPKNMGDALYFRIYAKLTDGSYIYTDIRGYNAIVYANNILKNSTDANMRSLVVAMLNYGAAAQQSLNYKTDSLMNAGLTAEHQALVKPYDANMMDDLVAVDASKLGNFAYNSAGFSGRKPSVSFDGAFAINYYFTTKFAPENGMKLYYWTLADYNAAATLTAENASGSMDMTDLGNNQFWGHVEDIVAKNIDETVFVAAVYTYGGVEYATGVLAYSVGSYCESMIAAEAGSATQAMTPICSGAAVYGFYAKEYFTALAQNNPA